MKYGFIYLWKDKKNSRYYVGRHWGTEVDGYICSSNWMRDVYRRRSFDFKRRIVKRIYTNQLDLVKEEQKWLDMIKPTELGKRYYNKTLRADSPSMFGRKHSEETKEKMRLKANGRKVSDETKEKLRQINLGKTYSDEINKKKGAGALNRNYNDPIFLHKMSLAAKNRSVETRKKISDNNKRLHKERKIGTYKNRFLSNQGEK